MRRINNRDFLTRFDPPRAQRDFRYLKAFFASDMSIRERLGVVEPNSLASAPVGTLPCIDFGKRWNYVNLLLINKSVCSNPPTLHQVKKSKGKRKGKHIQTKERNEKGERNGVKVLESIHLVVFESRLICGRVVVVIREQEGRRGVMRKMRCKGRVIEDEDENRNDRCWNDCIVLCFNERRREVSVCANVRGEKS